MTDVELATLVKELKYEAHMFGVSPYAKLYQRAADALEAIITDTTTLLEEGATRIEALTRENQALALLLEARIENLT